MHTENYFLRCIAQADMSQIMGARQGNRELGQRMANPGIDAYAQGKDPSSRVSVRGNREDDHNTYETNAAFGAYQKDSHAAQDMRNFYDTMDAVATRTAYDEASGDNVGISIPLLITNTCPVLSREGE
jgi:hypothetical protein